MNQRLINIYKEIKTVNSEKFLHNNLVVDPMWNTPIKGITLQIDLDKNVRDIICKFQLDLIKLEPYALLLLPRQYQHLSFYQVVYWGGKYAKGHTKTWEEIAEKFLTIFKQLNNTLPSFQITFSQLIATAQAIIWCGFDEYDELKNLRQFFYQKLSFPTETLKRNQIIHTTVARYKDKLLNPQLVMDYINSNQPNVTMSVKSIILRKENIYPSIDTTEIARISLF